MSYFLSPPECGLFFYLKFEGYCVAFSTADLWFANVAFGLFTICADLHPALKECKYRTTDRSLQLHVLT